MFDLSGRLPANCYEVLARKTSSCRSKQRKFDCQVLNRLVSERRRRQLELDTSICQALIADCEHTITMQAAATRLMRDHKPD